MATKSISNLEKFGETAELVHLIDLVDLNLEK
jgi:hypothetical protein